MESFPTLDYFFDYGIWGIVLLVILILGWRGLGIWKDRQKHSNPGNPNLFASVITENTEAVRENTGTLKKLCQHNENMAERLKEHQIESRESLRRIEDKLP